VARVLAFGVGDIGPLLDLASRSFDRADRVCAFRDRRDRDLPDHRAEQPLRPRRWAEATPTSEDRLDETAIAMCEAPRSARDELRQQFDQLSGVLDDAVPTESPRTLLERLVRE
jgi:hypothetical protein